VRTGASGLPAVSGPASIHDPTHSTAVAADDGAVRFWSLDSEGANALLGELSCGNAPVRGLASFSSGGEDWLASVGDDSCVRLWSTGREATLWRTLRGHEDWIRTVCIYRDGGRWMIATGGDDRLLRLWEAFGPDESSVAAYSGHINSIRGLTSFSSKDGVTVASTSDDGSIRLWRRGSGQIAHIDAHKASGLGICTLGICAGSWLLRVYQRMTRL